MSPLVLFLSCIYMDMPEVTPWVLFFFVSSRRCQRPLSHTLHGHARNLFVTPWVLFPSCVHMGMSRGHGRQAVCHGVGVVVFVSPWTCERDYLDMLKACVCRPGCCFLREFTWTCQLGVVFFVTCQRSVCHALCVVFGGFTWTCQRLVCQPWVFFLYELT